MPSETASPINEHARAYVKQILSLCNSAPYNTTTLCKLLQAYARGDIEAALKRAKDYLDLLINVAESSIQVGGKGSPISNILFTCAGPPQHWNNSEAFFERNGVVPWACATTFDGRFSKFGSGGIPFNVFVKTMAASFAALSRAGVTEVIAPLGVFYATQISSIVGFGVILFADVTPFRKVLWSGEACPPTIRGKCFTLRWYMLPLMFDLAGGLGGLKTRLLSVIRPPAAGRCLTPVSELRRQVNALRVLSSSLGRDQLSRVVSIFNRIYGAAGEAKEARLGGILAVRGMKWNRLVEKTEEVIKGIRHIGLLVDEAVVRLVVRLLAEGNVLVLGPPGFGKTLLGKIVAGMVDEAVFATCHSAWSRADFIGGPVLVKGGLEWRSGYLLRAIHAAVRGRSVLLLVDEVNRAEVDKVFGEFFSVFSAPRSEAWDVRPLCRSVCSEAGRLLGRDEVVESFCRLCVGDVDSLNRLVRGNLRIYATMNTVDYATVFSVGEAFSRRFFKVLMGFDNEEEIRRAVEGTVALLKERGVLRDEVVGVTDKLAEFLARLYRMLHGRGSRRGLFGVVVSQMPLGPAFIRDVLLTANDLLSIVGGPECALLEAIRLSTPVTVAFGGEEAERFRSALVSVFGEALEKCRGSGAGR